MEPIYPNALADVASTCADCYTWLGPRGSAHDPKQCPHRNDEIEKLRSEIIHRRQRLANLTGQPA